jgi:hypothetical protein
VAHDPTDDFVAIVYIIIVITTAPVLVSANEGEGGLGHFSSTQSCRRGCGHSAQIKNSFEAWRAATYALSEQPLRQKLLPLTGRRDLILTVCPEKTNQGDNVDKTLTWFMRMWGTFVDIWRERRRLRLQLHHDEAMTMALQKMIEATNQLKDSSLLNQR